MNLTLEEINKMKVAELKSELTARGLDTKGVKAILVDRLAASIASSPKAMGAGAVEDVGNGTAPVEEMTTPAPVVTEVESQSGSPRRSRRSGSEQKEGLSPTKSASPVKAAFTVSSPSKEAVPAVIDPEPEAVGQNGSPVKTPVPQVTATPVVVADQPVPQVTVAPVVVAEQPVPQVTATPAVVAEQPVTETEKKPAVDDSMAVDKTQVTEEVAKADVEMTDVEKKEEKVEGGEKRKLDETEETKDSKRPRTESEAKPAPAPIPENEPEFDATSVILDWCK